jgi:hypothetical protein
MLLIIKDPIPIYNNITSTRYEKNNQYLVLIDM